MKLLPKIFFVTFVLYFVAKKKKTITVNKLIFVAKNYTIAENEILAALLSYRINRILCRL